MSNFPTKENPQLCRNGCGAKIYLSDKKQFGKYLPYNPDDDTVHDCRDKDGPVEKPKKEKQEFTLEAVLKKLESIGIKINLMELMKG